MIYEPCQGFPRLESIFRLVRLLQLSMPFPIVLGTLETFKSESCLLKSSRPARRQVVWRLLLMVPFPTFLHTHLPFPWMGLAPAPLVHPDGQKMVLGPKSPRTQMDRHLTNMHLGNGILGAHGPKESKGPNGPTVKQKCFRACAPWLEPQSPRILKGTSAQQKHVFGAWAP